MHYHHTNVHRTKAVCSTLCTRTNTCNNPEPVFCVETPFQKNNVGYNIIQNKFINNKYYNKHCRYVVSRIPFLLLVGTSICTGYDPCVFLNYGIRCLKESHFRYISWNCRFLQKTKYVIYI